MNISKEKSRELLRRLVDSLFKDQCQELLNRKHELIIELNNYFSDRHEKFYNSLTADMKPWFTLLETNTENAFLDEYLNMTHDGEREIRTEPMYTTNIHTYTVPRTEYQKLMYLGGIPDRTVSKNIFLEDDGLRKKLSVLNADTQTFNTEVRGKTYELENHLEMFTTVNQLETVIPTIRAVIPERWVLEHERRQEEAKQRRAERAKERLLAQQLVAARAAKEKEESGIDITDDDASILAAKFAENF